MIKKPLFKHIFILFFLSNCFSAHAQSSPSKEKLTRYSTQDTFTDNSSHTRLKVGLVLSGGGAKGAAHIGVLKVLEKYNIAVDYIAGTSIGAYVAGLYALGYNADQIERIMLDLPWDDSYSDFIPRESLSYADKVLRDQYNLSVRIGFNGGKLDVPSGLLLGQSALQLLKQSTDIVGIFESFDQLAIPYRAVATDLVTANAVVLKSGSITQAMKASAAVPGAVEPVEINGKLLVDGGIANNMPIDVVKNMGADIVIAVDIGSSLSKKGAINNTIDVLNQLSTILTNNTSIIQKQHLAISDILIRPEIDNLSTTDFSIMDQALALGEQAAEKQLKGMNHIQLNNTQFNHYLNQKTVKSKRWFAPFSRPILAIEYHNTSQVNQVIIEDALALKVNTTISKEELKQAIDRVYALDRFEQVYAEFIDMPDGRILLLKTKAKAWGPNYLKFGFSLQSDISSNTIVAFDFAYLLTDITPNGGQWKNELSIGWESMLATEFYQPLGKHQHFFSRAKIKYQQDKWEKNKQRPELINEYFQALAGVGYNYIKEGVIEAGLVAQHGGLSFETSFLGDMDYTSLGSYLTIGYDNLNSINFPTQGNKVLLKAYFRKDKYEQIIFNNQLDNSGSSTDNSITLNFDWRGAFAIKQHTFVGITSFATVLSDSDYSVHISELGGFLNLSGYQKDALIGAHKAFAAIAYQYDLGKDLSAGSDVPIYLGTSLEAGNVWSKDQSIQLNDLIHSGSIYLGTDTSFGPAVIGVGYATDGEKTLFLSIGKNW